MSSRDEIELELRQYLEKHDNMINQDRVKYLLSIFDKHFTFSKMEYEMQAHEVNNIISMAKSFAGKQTLPVVVSGRYLEPSAAPNVALIESTISFLNSQDLLKKIVRINYSNEKFGKKE